MVKDTDLEKMFYISSEEYREECSLKMLDFIYEISKADNKYLYLEGESVVKDARILLSTMRALHIEDKQNPPN